MSPGFPRIPGSKEILTRFQMDMTNYNALHAATATPDPIKQNGPNDEIRYAVANAPTRGYADWDATFIVGQGLSDRQNTYPTSDAHVVTRVTLRV